MFDIIGDIHGQAKRLFSLLDKLRYKQTATGWMHSSRKAVFVGDYIDRNIDQLEVLNTIKTMVDYGHALACMGNHELNAIGWLMKHPDTGDYLRARNSKNLKQHQAFLDAVGESTDTHVQWIDWFKTLPVYLDLGEIRVVHACWDSEAISQLAPFLDAQHRIKPQYLPLLFDGKQIPGKALEILLKGKELPLPNQAYFLDKEQVKRREVRIKWWLSGLVAWPELAVNANDTMQLPDGLVNIDGMGYMDDTPVFIGHYWLTGKPKPLADHVACVDYSAAKEYGKLVAYRWHGEKKLLARHFVSVS